MARYPLNLPEELKREVHEVAAQQGVSFNQFVMWAVADKVATLRRDLEDPEYPQVSYRRGASGRPVPVVRGTGIRVQTLVVAARDWGLSPSEIAEQYGLTERQVKAALAFAEAHVREIEAAIVEDEELEGVDEQGAAAPGC